ncbi:MAG: YeeE/YedE thiosulfate transporter family protein [Filomicrobium sp.]
MTEFTPIEAALGGLLVGTGAVLLMALLGRIAGVSSIIRGVVFPVSFDDWSWRAMFIIGLLGAPILYGLASNTPLRFDLPQSTSSLELAGAGLLVGIGVTFGCGCASGHGVCGLSRFSARSVIAVTVFMLSAAATVFTARHVLGG